MGSLSDQKIIFIRHTQTQANVTGELVGRSDSPLTELGFAQLDDIVASLDDVEISKIFTSPAKRAKKLARAIQRKHPDTHCVLDGRLQEIDFGQAEGLRYNDLPMHGITVDYGAYNKPVIMGGESRAEVDFRMVAFLEEVKKFAGITCVVSHGGPIRSATAALLGLRPTDCWAFHIDNGAMIVIDIVDGRGVLEEIKPCRTEFQPDAPSVSSGDAAQDDFEETESE